MARMIPTSLERIPDTTAGERKIFDILKNTLPPDCVVRYEMNLGIKYKRPDFVALDCSRGIIIIEVKDWGVENIGPFDEHTFHVKGFQGKRTYIGKENPYEKIQIYLRNAQEQLASMPNLRNSRGDLIIPITSIIAFTNITQKDFFLQKYDSVINPDCVFFAEDINVKTFAHKYNNLLPTLPDLLSDDQIDDITTALCPDLTVPRVTLNGFVPNEKTLLTERSIEVLKLSIDQEEIAKSLGEGPRVLRGIAGTGKTLILLYRAKILASDPKTKKKILILCWNTSLANYMRQVYERLAFEATEGAVTIKHFSEFVRDLLNIAEDPDWDSENFTRQLIKATVREKDKYDAIYIDEAQDFRKEWIHFIFEHLLKGIEPKEKSIIVAADDAQRVYRNRDFRWSDLGIPMQGRSKILRTIYRNSARVWVFSSILLKDNAMYKGEEGDAEKLGFSTKGGHDPEVIGCKSISDEIKKCIEIIKSIYEEGFAYRNVLVLYRGKVTPDKYPLVDNLKDQLDANDLPYEWISEDRRAKRNFDFEAEKVKISTVHSAKGMDSPIVIVLGAENFQPDLSHDDEYKLMYVALTRARERLYILYSGSKGMVPALRECEEGYNRVRSKIIETVET